MAGKPKCDECNRPAKVLMRIGDNLDDWVYAMCDECLDYLCSVHHDEENGRVICNGCYQQMALLKAGIVAAKA